MRRMRSQGGVGSELACGHWRISKLGYQLQAKVSWPSDVQHGLEYIMVVGVPAFGASPASLSRITEGLDHAIS